MLDVQSVHCSGQAEFHTSPAAGQENGRPDWKRNLTAWTLNSISLFYQQIFDIIMIIKHLHPSSFVWTVISRQRVLPSFLASKTASPSRVLLSQPKRSERTVSAQYRPDWNNSLLRSIAVVILCS
jgi:hypothetical protein